MRRSLSRFLFALMEDPRLFPSRSLAQREAVRPGSSAFSDQIRRLSLSPLSRRERAASGRGPATGQTGPGTAGSRQGFLRVPVQYSPILEQAHAELERYPQADEDR